MWLPGIKGIGGAALLFQVPIPGLTEWLAAGLGSVAGIVVGTLTPRTRFPGPSVATLPQEVKGEP